MLAPPPPLIFAFLPKMDREEEAPPPPPPPPPFEPKLATVAKWFRDRRLSYDKRIEDVLIEWGVEQLEDIKLVGKNDWEKLLQYPKIKWKRFEKAFDNLTADEFNELKSDSILIRDTGTDAKSNGSASAGSGRNKEKSGSATPLRRHVIQHAVVYPRTLGGRETHHAKKVVG